MNKYKDAILYIIFIIIGFIYAIMRVKPEIVNIVQIEKDIATKTVESADLDRQIQTIKEAEAQKVTSTSINKNIYKPAEAGLDAESSFTVMFDDIIEMAKYNGVKIYSIEYVYNPADDSFVKGASDKYNVCLLNMAIVADYLDLESFLKEIYKYPYLISLNQVELAPYQKNKKILLTNLQLKLYSAKQ